MMHGNTCKGKEHFIFAVGSKTPDKSSWKLYIKYSTGNPNAESVIRFVEGVIFSFTNESLNPVIGCFLLKYPFRVGFNFSPEVYMNTDSYFFKSLMIQPGVLCPSKPFEVLQLLSPNIVFAEKCSKAKTWHYRFILDGGALQLWRAFAIVLACSAVRLFVKYVHQLESVAIRQTWCERIRESICWHSGQRYVINADFTLHWIELAMIATSPPLIHPIKPSLFIYLQPQPPDMHGMSALTAPHTQTHAHTPAKVNCAHVSSPISSKAVKDTHHYLIQAVSWL